MIKNIFKKFIGKSLSEKITYLLFFLFFTVMAVIFLYPILSMLMNSFRTYQDFNDPFRNPFALPTSLQYRSWSEVFTIFNYNGYYYFDMLINSLWILVVKISVNIIASTCVAYAVARYRFPGRNFLYGLVIFVQTIPIVGTGAASYKLLSFLGFVNNPTLIWICWANGFNFAFVVLYGAFKGVSGTYSEAAKIDGANNLVVLCKIIIPQVFPSIIAVAITQSITVWNEYSEVMIYLRNFPTISYSLYMFKQSDVFYYQNANALYSAAVIISMMPVLLLYACSQKLLLTNMTAGGLKG